MALDMQSSRGMARWVVLAVVALAAVAGTVVWAGAGKESTDDAQIDGRITQIAARVGGTVDQGGRGRTTSTSKPGTVLVEIDPKDYQVALAKAEAELADARAGALAAGSDVPIASVSTTSGMRTAESALDEAQAAIAVAERQLDAAQAQRTAADARLRERRAAATKADRDVERLKPLVAKEEVAQQQFDAAVATADGARAAGRCRGLRSGGRRSAPSPWRSSGRCRPRPPRPGPTPGSPTAKHRARADADHPGPRLGGRGPASSRPKRPSPRPSSLSIAPSSRRRSPASSAARRSRSGRPCRPAQPLMAIVAREEVWVVANFKETQLADMQPRAAGLDRGRRARRSRPSPARSTASAPRPAPSSACCRPTTPPATTSRSCSACPVKIVLDAGPGSRASAASRAVGVRRPSAPMRPVGWTRPAQRQVNPWIVAVAVMFATFMEVLDTTVVNVSLPHIAGNLSATIDESTWVLTSYLVANAIVLPLTGWLASDLRPQAPADDLGDRLHAVVAAVRAGPESRDAGRSSACCRG